MKLPTTLAILLFVFGSIVYAQKSDNCRNDTDKTLPVRNFRDVSGFVPSGCRNFTWVYEAENNKTDTLFAKFSSLNLSTFDEVVIKTKDSNWVFTSTSQNIDDYMISNSTEIEIQLIVHKNFDHVVFHLDLFAEDCGGSFTGKGKLNCQAKEKSGSKFYQLTAPEGQQVVINLNNLGTADVVEFYEGRNNKSAPLAKFTNGSVKYEVFSETNEMLVLVQGSKPVSDFSAEFASDADKTHFISQDSSGIWELVDAKPKLNYTWLINPSSGSDSYVIALSINEFNCEENDALIISQGLAHNPILVLNESLTSQRSFYFPSKNGVRVELRKANVSTKNEISVIIAYTIMKDCKLSLETAPDTIASPGYPSQYFYNADCKWSIANKNSKSYRVSIGEFDAAASDSLTYDFDKNTVEVDAKTSDLVFNGPVTFNWKSLINGTSISGSHRGFKLDVSTYDCGYAQLLNDSKSEISFPGIKKASKCFWTVNAPRKVDEVNNVQFTVTSSDNKLPLIIYDGGDSTATPIPVHFQDGKFVGVSRTNKLMFEISADKEIAAFKIDLEKHTCPKAEQCLHVPVCMHDAWLCDGKNDCGDWSDERFCNSTVASCGDQNIILDDKNTTTHVTLPLLNDTAKEDLNCLWRINTTQQLRTLVVQFGNQSLLNPLEILTILEGEEEKSAVKIYELTSNSPNTKDYVVTSNNTLWVNFISYHGSKTSNFTLNISSQTVGRRITKPEDVPIPQNQKSNVQQVFEVELQDDKQHGNLQVVANYKPSGDSPDWSLKFYDGFSLNQPPLGEMKSSSIINPIISLSNRMLVVAKGFHDKASGTLKIASVPTGTNFVNQTSAGSLYLNKVQITTYTWQIEPAVAKPDGIISLKLSQLKLLANDSFVLHRDDDRDVKIAQIDSTVVSPRVFHIPLKYGAFVEYKSTHESTNTNGDAILSASYEVISGCQQEFKLNDYTPQIIVSPDYPNMYPSNANCNWTITVPNGKAVHVSFNDFNLNKKHEVQIKTNTSIVLKATGDDLPDDLFINGTAYILWNSTAFNEADYLGRGFSLTVQLLDGAWNLTHDEGVIDITEVNKTTHYGYAVNVKAYEKDKPNVMALTVHPETHPNLVIYDGKSKRSPTLHNTTNNELTLTNTILLLYTFDKKSEDYDDEIDATDAINVTFALIHCNRTCNASKLCMHDDWVCNNVNDCGDNSDELNCSAPTPPITTVPPPTEAPPTPSCGAGWYVFCVIIGLIVGALLAIVIPILYKRFKGAGNYQRFGEGES